jgi:hypothetical protein
LKTENYNNNVKAYGKVKYDHASFLRFNSNKRENIRMTAAGQALIAGGVSVRIYKGCADSEVG